MRGIAGAESPSPASHFHLHVRDQASGTKDRIGYYDDREVADFARADLVARRFLRGSAPDVVVGACDLPECGKQEIERRLQEDR